MHLRAKLVVVLAIAALVIATTPVAAAAQVTGDCEAAFNGVDVDRIDSLGSPLELDTDDLLIFSGTDPGGTALAEVVMMIGPVALESGIGARDAPEEEFTATIDMDEVSAFGVGLFRIRGKTRNCSADAWLRLSGRFPLATLIGLLAMGLTLGGVTGQLGAVASRRRWARSAAALGGLATGPGLTLAGQEFGRLQVSYPSLAAVSVAIGGIGFLGAVYLSPALREERRGRRRQPATAPSEGSSLPEEAGPAARPTVDTTANRDAGATPLAPRPEPAVESAPYWCYVMAETDVFDLIDHTHTVASLEPGNWYLAKRTLDGWVHIITEDGTEGWVAEGAVHRQG